MKRKDFLFRIVPDREIIERLTRLEEGQKSSGFGVRALVSHLD